MKKRSITIILAVIILPAVSLWTFRAFSPRVLDDLSPEIPCEASLIEKSDILYIIPKFRNLSIDKEWCNKLLAFNKTLGMHGVYHAYQEFSTDRSEEYFNEGISIFTECFGFPPERFRPPNFAISKNNEALLGNVKLENKLNAVFHKVYHCDDSWIPNRIMDWL